MPGKLHAIAARADRQGSATARRFDRRAIEFSDDCPDLLVIERRQFACAGLLVRLSLPHAGFGFLPARHPRALLRRQFDLWRGSRWRWRRLLGPSAGR
jgi:hypothetical protein